MTAKQWAIWFRGQKAFSEQMNSQCSMIKVIIQVQNLKTAQDLGIETIVAIPGVPSTSQAPDHDYNYEHFKYDQREQIHTHVRREKFSEQTEHGTRNTTGGIISLHSSNTKQDHANHARYAHNAQDQKLADSFKKRICRILRKESQELMKRKSISINDVRLLLNIHTEQ